MFPVDGKDLSKSVAMLKLLVQHDRFAGLFVHDEARDSMRSVDGTAAAWEEVKKKEAAHRGCARDESLIVQDDQCGRQDERYGRSCNMFRH